MLVDMGLTHLSHAFQVCDGYSLSNINNTRANFHRKSDVDITDCKPFLIKDISLYLHLQHPCYVS